MRAALFLLLCACSAPLPSVAVDGEWEGGFFRADGTPMPCVPHGTATGPWSFATWPGGALTGQFGLCDGLAAGTVTGTSASGSVDFTILQGSVAVFGWIVDENHLQATTAGFLEPMNWRVTRKPQIAHPKSPRPDGPP